MLCSRGPSRGNDRTEKHKTSVLLSNLLLALRLTRHAEHQIGSVARRSVA